MKVIKFGDAIIIEVNYGERFALDAGIVGCSAVDAEDMVNPKSVVQIQSKANWHVCPADLHLVSLTDDEASPRIENVPKRIMNRIAKNRYYWVLKLVQIVPNRTKRAMKLG